MLSALAIFGVVALCCCAYAVPDRWYTCTVTPPKIRQRKILDLVLKRRAPAHVKESVRESELLEVIRQLSSRGYNTEAVALAWATALGSADPEQLELAVDSVMCLDSSSGGFSTDSACGYWIHNQVTAPHIRLPERGV